MQKLKANYEKIWNMMVSTSALYLSVWGIGKLGADIYKAAHTDIFGQFKSCKDGLCGKSEK